MQIWTATPKLHKADALKSRENNNPLSIYIYLLKFAARNAHERTERTRERRNGRSPGNRSWLTKTKHEIINEL